MPVARLSRSSIDKLPYPGKQTYFWDSKITGFGVRVNELSRSWLVRCHVAGKKIQVNLGRCDRVDIDVAVSRARAILEDAEQGIAPADRAKEKADQKQAAANRTAADLKRDITLGEVFTLYTATRKKLKASTVDCYQTDLDRYVSDWSTLPIRAITGDMVVTKHAEIGKTAPSHADSTFRLIRALLNFAIEMYDGEVVTMNPVKRLSKIGAWYNLERRKTYLADCDLKAWVNGVMNLPHDTPRDILLVILFTGARVGEVRSLTWDALNLGEGVGTFRDTKTGVPLTVPLCSYLVQLLTTRHEAANKPGEGYVFPSYGESGHAEDLRASLRLVSDTGGKLITPHDLRRTFISICDELEISVYTRKRLVNHALPLDVTEGYTMFSMDRLRRVVESVQAHIEKIVTP